VKALSGSKVYKNNCFCYADLLILSIIFYSNSKERTIAVKVSVSIAFVQLLHVCAHLSHNHHTIATRNPMSTSTKKSLAKVLNKHSKLGKILPFDFQETNIMMHAMITRITPTSTEIGLRDSKDASAAEITEHEVEQSLTTRWEETDTGVA
jgi:hypothetical protein